jgi:thiamine biosynthesis protein ThiI
MLYLIRYAEIALKSEPVRRAWEDLLIRNMKRSLRDCKIRRDRGRIWVEVENADKLVKTVGIQSFSPCEHCELSELDEFAIGFCKRKIKSENTFALRVRRVGEHEFSSQDVARRLGSMILKGFSWMKVDLEKPEKEVFIEIRGNDCYLFDRIIKGAGGIPLGAEGKLVSLFSGGIDSPVAVWMMMKRGCEIIPVYLDNTPFTDYSSLQRAEGVAEALREYQHDFRLRIIHHGDFLLRAKEILKKRKLEKYTCIICKRRMYRIAEEIAEEEMAKGIVTGESLGQVASQTLENLLVLNSSVNLPVYRPLIGFDKLEIENIAKKIGTYEKSVLHAKKCEAVPKKPATKSKLEKVLEIEEEIGH